MAQKIKASIQDKHWFAERCGELLVREFRSNISVVFDEALDRHGKENTPENRTAVAQAYRTANPNHNLFSESKFEIFYEAGVSKNGEKWGDIVTYVAIDREVQLHKVRSKLTRQFTEGKILTLDVDPDIIKELLKSVVAIFKYGEKNVPAPTGDHHKEGPSGRDDDDEEDPLGSAFRDAEGQLEAVGIYEQEGEEEAS